MKNLPESRSGPVKTSFRSEMKKEHQNSMKGTMKKSYLVRITP